MANPPSAQVRLHTVRDQEILASLDRTPLTVRQILRLSQTFVRPFTDEKRVRERMQILLSERRVRRFSYATAGRGVLCYYTLSPLGFHLLYGPGERLPSRRRFSSVRFAHEPHTRYLAEVFVHALVAASRRGLTLANVTRENEVRLDAPQGTLFPDGSFQLLGEGKPPLTFFIELDCGTERIVSPDSLESIERKIRLYEAYRDATGTAFRVLALTTRGPLRLRHMLEVAGQVSRSPRKSLVYGATMQDFLATEDIFTTPCFQDHGLRQVALVPAIPASRIPRHHGVPQSAPHLGIGNAANVVR